MPVDIQTAVVGPFNALRKRLCELLGDDSTATKSLPLALKQLASVNAASTLVTPALSADMLRIICDAGFADLPDSLEIDATPERTGMLGQLVDALLKQLHVHGRKHYHAIGAFRSDAEPFGYQCGQTKWSAARMCAKAAAATGDETFTSAYFGIISNLAASLELGERQVGEFSKVLEAYRHEKPFESVDGLAASVINSIGMKLALISPGEFMMGGSLGDKDADPIEEMPHEVRITKPFYLGVHQVTQEQYEHVVGENPSMFRGRFRPVEHLRWQDAVEFCRRLSELPAEQGAGRVYRLPTEAEWEYACRAATTTRFNTGDSLDASHACFAEFNATDGLSKPTKPVGSYPANPWGLHDMHGNVWEWCSDWFSREYYGDITISDPQGPAAGSYHVLRGGAASSVSGLCRSSSRGEAMKDGPSYDHKNAIAWYGDLGFRVVCSV
jgi:formylglycine-generating enzyme required for sulfatase activity